MNSSCGHKHVAEDRSRSQGVPCLVFCMHQHFIWLLVDGTLYEMVLLQMRERCGSSSNAEVAVEQGGQQAPELVES